MVLTTSPDSMNNGINNFTSFADENDMNLLLGIEPTFLLNASIKEIKQRIKKYIQKGLQIKKDFILYFNDIPADIEKEKLKKIFEYVGYLRKAYHNYSNYLYY